MSETKLQKQQARLAEIFKAISSAMATRESSLRAGQIGFNTLYEIAPDIADQIRGTDCDPFYANALIPRFYNRIIRIIENERTRS